MATPIRANAAPVDLIDTGERGNPGWPLTYFSYTGALTALVVLITYFNRLRLGDRGWMFTWQLVAIGVATLGFATAAAFASGTPSRLPTVGRYAMWCAAGCYAFATSVLMLADHRSYLIVVALLQTAVLLHYHPRLSQHNRIAIGAVAVMTWIAFSGLTYTHFADWLLNGSPSSGFALVAFSVSFWLSLRELSNDAHDGTDRFTPAWFVLALAVFGAYALRTDSLLTNWIPLHRSYFADVADFVRQGHWPLWDVPSLYGFLSVLALGKMPAANGWQATYELTAIFLVAQALMSFVMLRWARRGVVNAVFAILFPLATLFGDSIARYAWSGRLYPQGGLRFLWISALLFVAFLSHVWRHHNGRVALLRWSGHVLWVVALFWSVDNALWATILWVPYVFIDCATYPQPANVAALMRRLVSRAWPILALPAAIAAAIAAYYRNVLHVTPDWFSYIEFTGPFTKGAVRLVFHVQDFGAGWSLLLVIGAVGSVGIAAIVRGRWDVVRLLSAAWLALWGTASYFALEPLDMYVALLMAILVPACAIVIFVSREELRGSTTALLARLSLAPLAIITIALLLGEPSRMAAMQWHLDVIQDFPPLHGELAALMRRAGISPDDPVLVQNGPYWTELTQGMILPFVRLNDGRIAEYRSWLPVSPIGPQELMEGLSARRAHTYINRFLDRTHAGGWYVTYRMPSHCSALSNHLRNVRTVTSPNYSASLCRYV